MSLEKLHDILEWPFMVFFFVGVITAALNVTWGGFTPLIWFMVALNASPDDHLF